MRLNKIFVKAKEDLDYITRGHCYEIVEDDGHGLEVIDDEGQTVWVPKFYFY